MKTAFALVTYFLLEFMKFLGGGDCIEVINKLLAENLFVDTSRTFAFRVFRIGRRKYT
jgi:hypothetical protein